MDTITQAVFGAAVGQALFHRQLGRRALIYGAIAGTIPDLDVFVRTGDAFSTWQNHRGVSHSVFFGPVVGPILGWGAWRYYKWREQVRPKESLGRLAGAESLAPWIWLFILGIFTHPFLDLFTPYGTQLLAPFSDHRFAVDAMPIIDPVYTGILAVAVLLGTIFPQRHTLAMNAAALAVIGVIAYTLMAWGENQRAEAFAGNQLAEDKVAVTSVNAYPTLLQPYLRRIVAESDDAVRIGFVSTWSPARIEWQMFPKKDHPFIDVARRDRGNRILEWFAIGQVYWQIAQNGAGFEVLGRDLRYGGLDRSILSIWGTRTIVDRDGNIISSPELFAFRPEPSSDLIVQLWDATFGGPASRLTRGASPTGCADDLLAC